METDLSKSKYISTCGVNDKAGKTQETPCSLSSVINMWLQFGCQIKFLQNYILSDLLKSKSKFALKVNTANFPYSARPSPLPCSTVDSGCIRDKWLLTHCPIPHLGVRDQHRGPPRNTGRRECYLEWHLHASERNVRQKVKSSVCRQ